MDRRTFIKSSGMLAVTVVAGALHGNLVRTFADAEGNGIAAAPRADAPGMRYFGSSVHHEDIHVKPNEITYLADSTVVYGSLNF
ncbi:hypothetical protein ACIPIN_08760 [Pseudomonas sp. NPDC087697]|uniref:hypothetical protein n=1 Tax=Pseudomonas sp. NPDC087697 TaxID=3364447 RepID=UPI00381AD723